MSTAAINEKQLQPSQTQKQTQDEAEKSKIKTTAQPKSQQLVFPAIMTTLLLIPLLLVISIGLFICWRKNSMYESKGMACCRGHYFPTNALVLLSCPHQFFNNCIRRTLDDRSSSHVGVFEMAQEVILIVNSLHVHITNTLVYALLSPSQTRICYQNIAD